MPMLPSAIFRQPPSTPTSSPVEKGVSGIEEAGDSGETPVPSPAPRLVRRTPAPEPLQLGNAGGSSSEQETSGARSPLGASGTPSSARDSSAAAAGDGRQRRTRSVRLDPAAYQSQSMSAATQSPVAGAAACGSACGTPVAKPCGGAGASMPRPSVATANVAFCPTPVNHGKPGHVSFSSPLNSPVAITPYSEVYGVHPRFFDFDCEGVKQPTQPALAALAAMGQAPSSPARVHIVSPGTTVQNQQPQQQPPSDAFVRSRASGSQAVAFATALSAATGGVGYYSTGGSFIPTPMSPASGTAIYYHAGSAFYSGESAECSDTAAPSASYPQGPEMVRRPMPWLPAPAPPVAASPPWVSAHGGH